MLLGRGRFAGCGIAGSLPSLLSLDNTCVWKIRPNLCPGLDILIGVDTQSRRQSVEAVRHQLRPLFDQVVVKELDSDRMRRSGLVVPAGTHDPPPQQGIVLAVGPGSTGGSRPGSRCRFSPAITSSFPLPPACGSRSTRSACWSAGSSSSWAYWSRPRPSPRRPLIPPAGALPGCLVAWRALLGWRDGHGYRTARPAALRRAPGGRARHAARALLRPRLRAGDHPVHRADVREPDMAGLGRGCSCSACSGGRGWAMRG